MATALNPYLNFDGKTAAAMKFYKSVFGGELSMQTYAEVKMAETPDMADLIVHAVLKSDAVVLMASDTHPSRPSKQGDNIHLSLTGEDGALLSNAFNGLAAGGKVDMPLAKQFWGDTYGQLTDRFGVHWMVNIAAPKKD